MKQCGEFLILDGFNDTFRKMYWGQIWNRKTTWAVKWIAIKSLWIMWKEGLGK